MSAVVTAPQDQTKKGPLPVARIKIWIDIDNPPRSSISFRSQTPSASGVPRSW